jgi:hypothetical protein
MNFAFLKRSLNYNSLLYLLCAFIGGTEWFFIDKDFMRKDEIDRVKKGWRVEHHCFTFVGIPFLLATPL